MPIIEKKCEHCGELFPAKPANTKYCGNICRLAATNRNRPDRSRNQDLDVARAGMPKIESGMVRCLRCEKVFRSQDKINNRICKHCASYIPPAPDDSFHVFPTARRRRGQIKI